ncbi:uncharacterized protein isoform X2 [Rhodnius prolixus]|uniref:uncharacterized protein isoform X2 n=1 Tax=Rhodnius prolixus TaxID=13249 RepID=UPI003D18C9FA
MYLLNVLFWFYAVLAITSCINLFPEIDRNEEKGNVEDNNATTLQIVTAPVRDCPPGEKRLNGNCRKVFQPKGDGDEEEKIEVDEYEIE